MNIATYETKDNVTFMTDATLFKNLNDHQGNEPYMGWSNSATWEFWLYFSQECCLLDEMHRLRRVTMYGTINTGRLLALFNHALASGKMMPVSANAEGPVNVAEILEFYYQEYKWKRS